MKKALVFVVVTLALPASASARTDGGRQLWFRWPAAGTMTSPYGHDGNRWHDGVDIGILRSLSVNAASSGTVVQTGYVPGYSGYGNVVLVDVGSGFSTLYAHLSRPTVRVGARVEPGQRLGFAGCTGWCTGTHLHFELRYRGRAVDPTALFAR